ncbi:hypothetical protein OSTOST_09852 [Ostertagia ostertagi]
MLPYATTITISVACQSCEASQVSFDPANGDPGRIDSDFRVGGTNDPATDASTIDCDNCTAQPADGFFSLHGNLTNCRGVAAENQDMGQIVEALLQNCMDGSHGSVEYAGTKVNSVQCTEAPIP